MTTGESHHERIRDSTNPEVNNSTAPGRPPTGDCSSGLTRGFFVSIL
jgi:hypothetical protein